MRHYPFEPEHHLNTFLTVSQLNRQIRSWLEQDIGEVAVIGELSNLSKPSSGHFYFTLKDQTAQIKCVFFRNYHRPDTPPLKDGQQFIVRGKLSLYEARGDYQLIVQELTSQGLGELYQEFERLKIKLEQRGYFAADKKKALPRFPQAIAIITSASGAALQDILATLARRYPIAKVYVYASEVQGKTAAPQLVHALRKANADGYCQVIILARGGGSIEDLWAFNDEQLADAIRQSQIPVVSGVGHETDFTIADFTADLRAATPTAAAEAVTPNQFELIKVIDNLAARMILTLQRHLQHHQMQLSHTLAKMTSPEQMIYRHWQTYDYLQRQLLQYMRQQYRRQLHRLDLLQASLQAGNPQTRLQYSRSFLQQCEQRLIHAMTEKLHQIRQVFRTQMATLHAVSPLATLDRGYAIATYHQKILYDSEQVTVGDTIGLRLAKGQLSCKVLKGMP